ncbi:protein of unknown function [Methylocaldum szegediense]|uniref:Uncharacterized protein n=1 Tax=Methylocaldum szegediense TaxID=73780 RepID=A0ABM9I968_9GAMM|nr:protein of unknown function [Methylocaldum szegediense]
MAARGTRCSNEPGEATWRCGYCRNQTTLTGGTIFQAANLVLTTWFLALYLLIQANINFSALELMCDLGVCYRTAWLAKHDPGDGGAGSGSATDRAGRDR